MTAAQKLFLFLKLSKKKKNLLLKFYFVCLCSNSLISCSGIRIRLRGGKTDRGLCVDEIKPHPKIIFFTEQLIFFFPPHVLPLSAFPGVNASELPRFQPVRSLL